MIKRAAAAPPSTLNIALIQSEQVKNKVEECAETLSSVNAVLQEEMAPHLPLKSIESALSQSAEVANKVEECIEDLSLVNQALAEEISARETLENALSKSRIEEEKSRYLALHDAVTGLPNRALFQDRLDIALAQAQRHERGIAVLFMDLDGFKQINDSHGHAMGDKILGMVGERLQASTRAEDTVSRHGGDEFMCLLMEMSDEHQAAKIAEKITLQISAPCEIAGEFFNVKLSIGIAMFPADGKTTEVLINNADLAMYEAKKNIKSPLTTTNYRFFRQIGA